GASCRNPCVTHWLRLVFAHWLLSFSKQPLADFDAPSVPLLLPRGASAHTELCPADVELQASGCQTAVVSIATAPALRNRTSVAFDLAVLSVRKIRNIGMSLSRCIRILASYWLS